MPRGCAEGSGGGLGAPDEDDDRAKDGRDPAKHPNQGDVHWLAVDGVHLDADEGHRRADPHGDRGRDDLGLEWPAGPDDPCPYQGSDRHNEPSPPQGLLVYACAVRASKRRASKRREKRNRELDLIHGTSCSADVTFPVTWGQF